MTESKRVVVNEDQAKAIASMQYARAQQIRTMLTSQDVWCRNRVIEIMKNGAHQSEVELLKSKTA